MAIGDEPPEHGRAAPREAGDALDGGPTPAVLGVHAVHHDRRVDRGGGVHEAPTQDVQDHAQLQWLRPPQREQARDAADLPEERRLATPAFLRHLATHLDEDGDAQGVARPEAVHGQRFETVFLLEKQGEELHGHAGADGGNEVAKLDHQRHEPLLPDAEDAVRSPVVRRGRGFGVPGAGAARAHVRTGGLVSIGSEALTHLPVKLGRRLL
mmetsp:Transcript_109702/g.315856  ORF Transcript_109702/g.315856 Transcript_109702/m.315856 type:complete len:211 (+) Transcript_109702:340-972(+)